MRLPSNPGFILIVLFVSACASSATSEAVATPTSGGNPAQISPSTQPSATADQAPVADLTPSTECINPPMNLLTLASQSDPVTCYGGSSLTVDAYLTGAGEIDGPCLYVEPVWLGGCGSFVALYPVLGRTKFSPSLFAAIDPASRRMLDGRLDRNVRVVGHYDDPAAPLCHPRGEAPHPGSDWINACRATFVLTSIELLAP